MVTLWQMERACFIFLWLTALSIPTSDAFGSPRLAEKSISDKVSVFEENGKVGLKDEEGQILIPASYDAIGWSNGKLSIVDKVVGYRSHGLWGLIHTSNKVVTPAEFIELRPGEGSLLIAQKKSGLSQRASFGIVNTGGKTIIPFLYDDLQLSGLRAIVMSKSGVRFHFGLLDLSNKFLIPIEYQRIYSLGSLRYAVENSSRKIAIFSDDGGQITDFLIDSISVFKYSYAIVYQNQRQGLIDRSGQVIVKPAYREIRITDNGSIQARNVDSWLFLDGKNNLIRQINADDIVPLSPYHYAVKTAGEIQVTDNNFQPINSDLFSSVSAFRRGVAVCKTAGRAGAIDTAGKIILPAQYRQLIPDENSFLACRDSNHKNAWFILDAAGKTLTEKHYECVRPFNGKFYPVRNRGFWGAVNAAGKEIVSCVHDSLVQQQGNHIVVKFKGEYGIIDLQENWIVAPEHNRLEVLKDDKYFEFSGKTTFLKSFSGNIIYFSDNRLEFLGGRIWEQLPSGGNWIIDMNGVIIARSNQPEQAELIFPESEGLRAIRKDGKYGFIDAEGRLRIANRYENVKCFAEGMAAVRIMNQWGFIDHQEKLAVQPVYDEVEDFHNGLAKVKKNNLWGLIDPMGNVVLPLRYDEIVRNEQSRWKIRQRNVYGLATSEGAVLIHPKYDELNDTGNGYVIVTRGGKCGLLTIEGVSTIPMIYDQLTFDVDHNQYLALKRSQWETLTGIRLSTHGSNP